VKGTIGDPEIDVKLLNAAIDNILDHLIEELGLQRVSIDPSEDYYWECPIPEAFDMNNPPSPVVGRLVDDLQFSKLICRARGTVRVGESPASRSAGPSRNT
jgi:hypothetical protein